MFTNQSSRIGLLAGGIAMMIALFAMELIARVLGPHLLLTEYMTDATMRRLSGFSGEVANFLLGGSPQLRITIFLLAIFLVAGAGLGRWANQNPGQISQRVMQATSILFFATLTVIYLNDFGPLDFYLQEVLLTLALSFLVYAVVLNRLLEPHANQTRWRIAGAIAVTGLIVILQEVLFT